MIVQLLFLAERIESDLEKLEELFPGYSRVVAYDQTTGQESVLGVEVALPSTSALPSAALPSVIVHLCFLADRIESDLEKEA